LLGQLEQYKDGLIVTKDTSIWEEKQKDKKHFAFSTAAAIKGLECFDQIASERGDRELHELLQKKLSLLQKGFNQAFVPNGTLQGAVEDGIKNEVDGAMLSAVNFGIVTDNAVIRKAMDNMQRLKMPSGGYRRVTSNYEDPAIFEYWYERQEFLFIDFSMAEVFLRLKEPDKAASLLKTIVDKAALDHNLIPEMFVSEKNYRFKGEVGDPTGAIPMVGYGAGVFISYLLEREALGYDN
jgi:GH15 family glucan-1,4-alpha-glucosidase